MYKIFVNDKPIILSDEITSDSTYEFCLLNDLNIEEVLYRLRFTHSKGFYIYHTDLQHLLNKFKSFFEVVEAAGGLVIKEEKLLLIYRNNHWDLPKGKMERGESVEETAIREVEEECGVFDLIIKKSLQDTYHVFYEDKLNKLKITHWFIMNTTYDKKLIPQQKEGISIAKFIELQSITSLYNHMYANIRELLINYFKTDKK